jgi:hypothetical protein
VQSKQKIFFILVIGLVACLSLGCRSGPAHTDDSAYRSIERDAERNRADLTVTGAGIAAGVERAAGHAAQVASELDSLGTAIEGSNLGAPEKGALLRQVAVAQGEAAALQGEVDMLRLDAGLLNSQLEEQRDISAALSAEHDRREAMAAALEADLAEKALESERYQSVARVRLMAILALGLVVVGYIAFRVCRFLKIIPAWGK